MQEILIGLHGKRHTWDEQRPFMPWLYTITRYKFIDTARRLRREAVHRVNITMEEFSEIFEASPVDIDRGLLDMDRHLAELPRAQRAVVQALGMEAASVREPAAQMHASEGSVRVLSHRALRRLTAKARQDQDDGA